MKIEFLYFDGCPSWQTGLENLKSALELDGVETDINLIKVEDDDHARRLKFLGSPSFRIEDHDLWYEKRDHYSLSCRVYPTPEGIKGFPTIAMLRQQLKQFKRV